MDSAREPAAARPTFLPLEPSSVAAACRDALAAIDSAASPAETLEGVVGALHEQLGSSFVAVLVAEHNRLWMIASKGFGLGMTPDGIPLSAGVVGRAARTGRIQYVPDLAADPSYIQVVHGVVSEIAIPVLASGELLGVVNIETVSPLPRQAPRLLRPLASALAPAVAGVRYQRTLDFSGLARLFVQISSLRDPREIAEIVVSALARILPLETGQLFLRSDDGTLELVSALRGAPGTPEVLTPEDAEALCERTNPSTVIDTFDLAALQPRAERSSVPSAVVLPLRANGETLGLLVATSRWPQQFSREQGEVASVLAAQAAAALDAALALGRERRSALTDSLTGLLNRRGFEFELEAALASAEERRLPVSLWVLDCDDFKEVNDRAGHEFGDALLREVGRVLADTVPATARPGRLGGDEFVVMLPGLDSESAERVAADVSAALGAGLDDAGFPLRLSGGIATFPFDGGGSSQLIRAADQALYEAKDSGKNQIVAFRELVREGSRPTARGRASNAADARTKRSETAMLVEAADAATAISRERSPEAVLERLCKTITFVVGATGCNLSRVVGNTLFDVTVHSLRNIELSSGAAYVIDDFPVTKAALESGVPKAISFLDDDLDRAEAFVLRDLKMNCALLLPIVVDGEAWGLAELYDVRLRRFSREQEAVAEFLVSIAARRIETLGSRLPHLPILPVYRPPAAE